MRTGFCISILANIGLVIALVLLLVSNPAVESPPSDVREVAGVEKDVGADATVDEISGNSTPRNEQAYGKGLNPETAGQLESRGISRDVIANLVLGELHRQWDQRFVDLERRYAPKSVPEWEYVALSREREEREVRALEEALGEERYSAWDRARTMRSLNPGGVALGAEELLGAYDLQKAFEKEHRELQRSMDDGLMDRADASVLQAFALEERDRQLAELLGEETFREMRGWVDPLDAVYQEFGDIDLSDSQAERALEVEDGHRSLQDELRRNVASSLLETDEVADELAKMDLIREERLREILGAEAYDSSERQKDPLFKTLVQYADTWELSDREVQLVYTELDAFHDQVVRFRDAAGIRQGAGQDVDWRQLEGVVERDRQRIETRLESLIGAERLERLERNELLEVH